MQAQVRKLWEWIQQCDDHLLYCKYEDCAAIAERDRHFRTLERIRLKQARS